jgi:hypothetical protein
MNKTPIKTIRQTPVNIVVPVIIISLSTIIFALVIDYSSTHIFNEFIQPLGKGDIDAEGVSTLISMFSVIAFPLAFIGTYFSTKFIKVEFSEENIKQIGYYSSVSIVVVLALSSSPFVIGGIAYSIFLLPKLLRKWLKQMISNDLYNQPSSVS